MAARGDPQDFINKFRDFEDAICSLPAHLICNVATTVLTNVMASVTPESTALFHSVLAVQDVPGKFTLGHSRLPDFDKAEFQHQLVSMWVGKVVEKQITEANCNHDLFLYRPLIRIRGRLRDD